MSMKNSNDKVGNRNRGDLSACSAVPQPNASSRYPPPSPIVYHTSETEITALISNNVKCTCNILTFNGNQCLYSSQNIILIINRRMKWAGHVALWGRGADRVWWGILQKRDHLEDNGGDGSAISNRVLTKQVGGRRLDWSGSGYRQVLIFCE